MINEPHPFEAFVREVNKEADLRSSSRESDPYEDYREALRMGGTESATQALRATLAGAWLSDDPLDRDPYSFLHRLFRNVLGSTEHDVFRLSLLSLLESYQSGEYECGSDTLHAVLSLCSDSSMRKREPDAYKEVLRNALDHARETDSIMEATHVLAAMADSRLFYDAREWLSWALEFGPDADLACFEGLAVINISRALLWLQSECPGVSRQAILRVGLPALIGLKDDDTVEAALAALDTQLSDGLVEEIVAILAEHSGMDPAHHRKTIHVLRQQATSAPPSDTISPTLSTDATLAELRASQTDTQTVESIVRRRQLLLDTPISFFRTALLAMVPERFPDESLEDAGV